MSEALNQLLRQAEAQKIQIEMDLLFKKNLNTFKNCRPIIYEKLKSHPPTNVVLHLDPNGQINLADKASKTYFYNAVPTEYCANQVKEFKSLQRLTRFTVNENKEYNDQHIHIPHLNALLKQYKSKPSKTAECAHDYITNLIITGVGLGYHIPLVMAQHKIQNIFIFEHCLDTFYAAMHTIDWEPILNHFQSERRSITFSIGETENRALERIEGNLHSLGLHNHAFSFIFPHSHRESEKHFVERYLQDMQSYIGGLGYFDDEQIGLAHAYHNLCNGIPIFSGRKTYNRQVRIAIIGNGPSLDEHTEYLLANQDKMVVMTCGTALGSVLKMGIKPDFHVEMERTSTITDFLTYNISEKDRKDITLLCLHTVSPEVIKIFDDAYCALKPEDAGTSLVQDYFQAEKPTQLYFCNPTVTNCGLSLAVSMGFKDVHLIGVDLGFTDKSGHHSKNSLHYELENKAKDKKDFKYGYNDKAAIEVKGNFGNTVNTHPILNISRLSFERLLHLTTSAFTDFTCYNSNNGALIAHTTPCKLDNIPAPLAQNKQAEVAAIKQDCFIKKDNAEFKGRNKDDFLAYFFSIENDFKIQADIPNEEALMRELQRLFNMISCAKDPITHRLLKGSANAFFASIVEHSLYLENSDEFKRNVDIGAQAFNRFIDEVYAIMKNDPFKVDNTRDPIFKKIKS